MENVLNNNIQEIYDLLPIEILTSDDIIITLFDFFDNGEDIEYGYYLVNKENIIEYNKSDEKAEKILKNYFEKFLMKIAQA